MSKPKILLAVDFSERSLRALEYAEAHAKAIGATLLITHVYPVASSDEGEGMVHAGVETDDPATVERRLQSVKPRAAGSECEHRLLKGTPAREILRLAREEGVDLIVAGTHGRTGLMRLVLGSVAEDIARHAPCPVLLVRMPE